MFSHRSMTLTKREELEAKLTENLKKLACGEIQLNFKANLYEKYDSNKCEKELELDMEPLWVSPEDQKPINNSTTKDVANNETNKTVLIEKKLSDDDTPLANLPHIKKVQISGAKKIKEGQLGGSKVTKRTAAKRARLSNVSKPVATKKTKLIDDFSFDTFAKREKNPNPSPHIISISDSDDEPLDQKARLKEPLPNNVDKLLDDTKLLISRLTNMEPLKTVDSPPRKQKVLRSDKDPKKKSDASASQNSMLKITAKNNLYDDAYRNKEKLRLRELRDKKKSAFSEYRRAEIEAEEHRNKSDSKIYTKNQNYKKDAYIKCQHECEDLDNRLYGTSRCSKNSLFAGKKDDDTIYIAKQIIANIYPTKEPTIQTSKKPMEALMRLIGRSAYGKDNLKARKEQEAIINRMITINERMVLLNPVAFLKRPPQKIPRVAEVKIADIDINKINSASEILNTNEVVVPGPIKRVAETKLVPVAQPEQRIVYSSLDPRRARKESGATNSGKLYGKENDLRLTEMWNGKKNITAVPGPIHENTKHIKNGDSFSSLALNEDEYVFRFPNSMPVKDDSAYRCEVLDYSIKKGERRQCNLAKGGHCSAFRKIWEQGAVNKIGIGQPTREVQNQTVVKTGLNARSSIWKKKKRQFDDCPRSQIEDTPKVPLSYTPNRVIIDYGKNSTSTVPEPTMSDDDDAFDIPDR